MTRAARVMSVCHDEPSANTARLNLAGGLAGTAP